jgi:hypothetical protein
VADEFSSYREWLGLADGQPSDHYALLSLSPFESDRAKIALAAEQAATKVRSFRPGPRARQWSHLLDEIQQAKNCLLDSIQKMEYDRSLRESESYPAEVSSRHFSFSGPAAAFSPNNLDLYPPTARPDSRIASDLLPPARNENQIATSDDSSAPLSADDAADLPMAYPVHHASAVPHMHDSYAAAPSDPKAAPSPIFHASAGLDPMAPVEIPSPDQPSPIPVPTFYAPQPARSPSLSVEHLLVLGILGASLVVIGAGMWIAWKRNQTAAALPSDPPPSASPEMTPPRAIKERAPSPMRPKEAGPTAPPAPDPSAPLTPSVPSTPEPGPPLAQPASPSPASPPSVSRAEVLALASALISAKQSLGELNFAAAAESLTQAESLAKLPDHQTAVTRLRAVSGFVERFQLAITAALRELQAGESFTVGASTEVAFVEASQNQITLHLGGMNRTYDLNDLPAGLAMALADFTLPDDKPTSRVIKGAYLLVHKRSDTELREKARLWWHEAHSRGLDLSQLLPFLNDDYDALIKDLPGKFEKN